MGREGMIIEQKGPEGPNEAWVILVGLGVGVGLALVGLAILSFATQAGTALIVVAAGQAAGTTLYGVARVVLAIGQARGLHEYWVLMGMKGKPLMGPNTREDVRELFD
jgi:hypothetical protein